MEYNVFPQNLLRSYRILAFSWESLDGSSLLLRRLPSGPREGRSYELAGLV
jgi:hypothetical protein